MEIEDCLELCIDSILSGADEIVSLFSTTKAKVKNLSSALDAQNELSSLEVAALLLYRRFSERDVKFSWIQSTPQAKLLRSSAEKKLISKGVDLRKRKFSLK